MLNTVGPLTFTDFYGEAMIDIGKERLYLLSEFAQLPQIGRHQETVRDWIKSGRKTLSGGVAYLERIKSAGGVQTSLEAYERWIRELSQ